MAYIEVTDLKKSYGEVQAVKGVSFTVKKGEIFTIIGPNGAGKTTTLEMMEGLISPDDGKIVIDGLTWEENGNDIRQMIGVQPQTSALLDLLTVDENLDLFASFFPKNRPVEEILSIVNLTDHRKKQVKKLSGGQKQRLAIGLAMISDPDIIFLDEPTTGLDPQARRNIWDIIIALKELGKTTILTTHYMEEAEKLSDRVCIIDQGSIIALDPPHTLIEKLSTEREIKIVFTTLEEASQAMGIIKDTVDIQAKQDGNAIVFTCKNVEDALYEIVRFTRNRNLKINQIAIKDYSLEDVFLSYTGKEWRD